MKHAVPEARAWLEKANGVQELDGRLAVLLQDVMELTLVHRGVQLHRNAQVVGPASRLTQELRRAGVKLARVEHRADAPAVGAVVLLDERHGALEPGDAVGLVPFPDDPAAVERVAGGPERRAHVGPHAELARDSGERSRAPGHRTDVHDRRGTGAERRPEPIGPRHVGAIARARYRGAPAWRDVAHEVAPEVVGLEPVEEHRLARVGGGVQMTVDQARGDELAGGVDATIDRSVERRPDVDDVVVLEDHAPVRNQLVSATAVADHPAALDQRSHRLAPPGTGIKASDQPPGC